MSTSEQDFDAWWCAKYRGADAPYEMARCGWQAATARAVEKCKAARKLQDQPLARSMASLCIADIEGGP